MPRPFSDRFPPDRYADFYDFEIPRRLYACPLVVAGRLQDGWERPRPPGCEKLVSRAVLDHAETCSEEATGEQTAAFGDLRDLLFEDFDHEYRFDPAFDGIDDPDTDEASQVGVDSLHPSS